MPATRTFWSSSAARLIAAIAAVLLSAGGCGTSQGSVTIPVQTGPIIRVAASSELKHGMETASTTPASGTTYQWTLGGAEILAGHATPQVTYYNGPAVSASARRAAASSDSQLVITLAATDLATSEVTTTTLVLPEVEQDDPAPADLVYTPSQSVSTRSATLPASICSPPSPTAARSIPSASTMERAR
jgi:hypothetical protein